MRYLMFRRSLQQFLGIRLLILFSRVRQMIFKFVYNPGGANTYSTYPFNPSNFGSVAQRFNMAHTYMRVMDSLNDARVFMTTEPAWGMVPAAETNPCQYKYFKGASTGEPLATMYGNANCRTVFLYQPVQVL